MIELLCCAVYGTILAAIEYVRRAIAKDDEKERAEPWHWLSP